MLGQTSYLFLNLKIFNKLGVLCVGMGFALTKVFVKGKKIPKEKAPSIGPPHMPWILRAA